MQQANRIDVHGLSIPGTRHDKNHDHFAIASLNKSMRLHQSNLTIDDRSLVHGNNQGHLFLVADGVSGGPAPARASSAAIDSVVQYFLNDMPWTHVFEAEPAEVQAALENALGNAHEELGKLASSAGSGMGTTVTLAFVFWPHLYLAHVGDSRCYLSRDGDLRQLTTDHTMAELRREQGGRVTKRSRNILWNAVGGRRSAPNPEVGHVVLEPGDVLALVTDGVVREKSELRIRRELERDDTAERLCDSIVDGAGEDDRTAVVIRFMPHEPDSAAAASEPAPALDEERDEPKPGVVHRMWKRIGSAGERGAPPTPATPPPRVARDQEDTDDGRGEAMRVRA